MRRADQRRLAELILWALHYREVRLALLAVALIGLGIWLVMGSPGCQTSPPTVPTGSNDPWPDTPPIDTTPVPAGPGEYLLCFWNVENLFDDRDDNRSQKGDKEYDEWFSHNPDALKEKLKHLTDVLVGMNDGRGPDILCIAEIESLRAGQLLQEAFNRRVSDPKDRYTSVLYDDPSGGRNIATAILTRLPVVGKPETLGSRLRILEGRIQVEGHPLILIASHWSSRISDRTGATRAKYADIIHGRFRQLYTANARVDFLVCGDFNDNPDDPSVTEHLHAIGDVNAVRNSNRVPSLLNLMDRLWKEGQASHYYGAKGYLFDQICVSPGMLDDDGWSVDPASTTIIQQKRLRNGRPDRFGGESDKRPFAARGASDHFPVTVKLRVR